MELEWRLFWKGDDELTQAYVGSYPVGRITRTRKNGRIVYIGNLHVPHIYGPVVEEDNMMLARKGVRAKITEWLERFSDEPPEDTESPRRRTRSTENTTRKKRTRPTTPQVRRRRVR